MGIKVLLNYTKKIPLFVLSTYSFNLILQHCCYISDPISLSGNLLQVYEVFSKCLRGIEGIPLKVSSVQPLDSGLFSCSFLLRWALRRVFWYWCLQYLWFSIYNFSFWLVSSQVHIRVPSWTSPSGLRKTWCAKTAQTYPLLHSSNGGHDSGLINTPDS